MLQVPRLKALGEGKESAGSVLRGAQAAAKDLHLATVAHFLFHG